MSNEDDEKITLRDKIALSLLDGYLNGNGPSNNDEALKDAILNPNKNENNKAFFAKVENRVRAAYKMADLIRKIRLEIFS